MENLHIRHCVSNMCVVNDEEGNGKCFIIIWHLYSKNGRPFQLINETSFGHFKFIHYWGILSGTTKKKKDL